VSEVTSTSHTRTHTHTHTHTLRVCLPRWYLHEAVVSSAIVYGAWYWAFDPTAGSTSHSAPALLAEYEGSDSEATHTNTQREGGERSDSEVRHTARRSERGEVTHTARGGVGREVTLTARGSEQSDTHTVSQRGKVCEVTHTARGSDVHTLRTLSYRRRQTVLSPSAVSGKERSAGHWKEHLELQQCRQGPIGTIAWYSRTVMYERCYACSHSQNPRG
jgi:hypothetical protein